MRTITLNSYPATSVQLSPPLMGYCKPFLKVNKQTNISSNNYPSSFTFNCYPTKKHWGKYETLRTCCDQIMQGAKGEI